MSIKLLVADDSITIQKVIGIIFSGEEYSLTVVDNGLAAVEKARELSPDVLLIDALMPGMTGYEVCEAVRAIPALAAKPILILTGSFEPFDEERAIKCGADDFLAKPFESQQIVTKVKELAELGASRAARPAAAPPVTAPEPVSAFTLPEAEPFAAFEFTEADPAAAFAPSPTEPAATFDFSPAEPDTPFTAGAAAIAPPEAPQATAPSDIWGAFTPDVEPSPVAPLSPEPLVAGFSDAFEPDVFAIVNEESDSQLVQPVVPSVSSPQNTGMQWIPVAEQTFEFEEESIADIPLAALSEQGTAGQSSGFGDIVFEEGEAVQKIPVSTAVVIEPAGSDFMAPEPEFSPPAVAAPSIVPEYAPLESVATSFIAMTSELRKPVLFEGDDDYVPPLSAPAVAIPTVTAPTVTVPAALSEEQLKAAISAVSKEVIERIVWEVVPDLAEAMIRDAIRKIKEGV